MIKEHSKSKSRKSLTSQHLIKVKPSSNKINEIITNEKNQRNNHRLSTFIQKKPDIKQYFNNSNTKIISDNNHVSSKKISLMINY